MSQRTCAPTIAIASAIALSLTGCIPIPIPHTAQVTPAAVGELRRSDGTPSALVSVALTASSRDTSCAKAAVQRVTDSSGRFDIPAARQRKTIVWLTLMENLGLTQYWLCAGASDSAGHLTYRSRTSVLGHLDGDSLKCLEWAWRETPRVTCENARGQQIVTRGAWTQGTSAGTYRMILAEDDEWGHSTRPFIQWLEVPSAGGPLVVRGVAVLPVMVGGDYLTEIVLIGGRWHVTAVTAISRKKLTFELGPPTEFRQVPD